MELKELVEGGGVRRLSKIAILNEVLLIWPVFAIFRLFQTRESVYRGIYFNNSVLE